MVSCEKTTLVSRNITVMGRRTSVRLEPEMWDALKDIADREKCTIHDICTLIKMRKQELTSLTAAIRVFLMLYFRASSTDEGHAGVRHGDFVSMIKRARLDVDGREYFSAKVRKSLASREVAIQQMPRMNVHVKEDLDTMLQACSA